MTIEIINGKRVITPSEGYWLYNEGAQVISDKVWLGVNANKSDWVEIPDERKIELESLWERLEEGEYINGSA